MGLNKYETCKNTLFDQLWGEYVCTKHQHVMYDDKKCDDCDAYEKRTDDVELTVISADREEDMEW